MILRWLKILIWIIFSLTTQSGSVETEGTASVSLLNVSSGASTYVVTPPPVCLQCPQSSATLWACRPRHLSIDSICSRSHWLELQQNTSLCQWVHTGRRIRLAQSALMALRVQGLYKLIWSGCGGRAVTCRGSHNFVADGLDLTTWRAQVETEIMPENTTIVVRVAKQYDKCNTSQYYFNHLSVVMKIYTNLSYDSLLFDPTKRPIIRLKHNAAYHRSNGSFVALLVPRMKQIANTLSFSVEVRPSYTRWICDGTLDTPLTPCPTTMVVHTTRSQSSHSLSGTITPLFGDAQTSSTPQLILTVALCTTALVSTVLLLLAFRRRYKHLIDTYKVQHCSALTVKFTQWHCKNDTVNILLLACENNQNTIQLRDRLETVFSSNRMNVYTVHHPAVLHYLLRQPSIGDMLFSPSFAHFKLVLLAPTDEENNPNSMCSKPTVATDAAMEKCESLTSKATNKSSRCLTKTQTASDSDAHSLECRVARFVRSHETLSTNYRRTYVITNSGQRPAGHWASLTPARVFSAHRDTDLLLEHLLSDNHQWTKL